MLYILPHLYIQMQNMLQMKSGLLSLMTISREFSLEKQTPVKSLVADTSLDFCLCHFRYADHPNAYWTGYFTSRPALKGYIRAMSAYYMVRKFNPDDTM